MTGQGPYRYDLFISHAAADRAWVTGYLADALRQAGVRWYAEAAFPPGVARLAACEQAIQESRRVVLILSPAYLADGFPDVVALLARQHGTAGAIWPVSPILLQPVTLPARLPTLPTLDASDPRRWPRVVNRLCSELGCPLRGPAQKPACPYPGLRAFSATDVPRFYGRDAEIGTLLGHLRHGRIALVVGAAGAGKSSLVQAGLIPQLPASLYWPPGFWLARTVRPGPRPVQALAEALHATQGGPREALTDLLAGHFPAGRLLLVIDPLEELFTLAPPAEQERFIAAVQTLRADARCALILVMRSDFYPDLMTSGLWPIGVQQRLEVEPLRGPALRQAVQQPALQAGVQVEGDLLARLLADAAVEPDALPLLQATLVGLWDAMEHRLLTLRAYQQAGRGGSHGLAAAFTARMDATLEALAPEEQALARRLFLRLVQPGEGRADTRRPRTVADLGALEDDLALVGAVLRTLTEGGLLVLSGPDTDPATSIDLAHEALIVRWPRLRAWLRERREVVAGRRSLHGQTHAWVRRPVSRDDLTPAASSEPSPSAPPATPADARAESPLPEPGWEPAGAGISAAPAAIVAARAPAPRPEGTHTLTLEPAFLAAGTLPALAALPVLVVDPLASGARREEAVSMPAAAPEPVTATLLQEVDLHALNTRAVPEPAPLMAPPAQPTDPPEPDPIPAPPPGAPSPAADGEAPEPDAAAQEERERARELAIAAARERLARLAVLRAEDDRRQVRRLARRQTLARLARWGLVALGVLFVIALLALGLVWLGWGF
jgi:hypothetical protein